MCWSVQYHSRGVRRPGPEETTVGIETVRRSKPPRVVVGWYGARALAGSPIGRTKCGFVASQEALDSAATKGRHATVCRSFAAITNLVVACSSLEQSVGAAVTINDEDLVWQMERSVVDVVRCNPELAVSAARQLGWTVIPPDGSDNEGVPIDDPRRGIEHRAGR